MSYSSFLLDSKLIGIIEIQGTEKPHRVIKNIDRLVMNEVFVRHGTTTAKASPDEMFRMRGRETEIQREIKSLTQGAEKHLKLRNIDQAINAYSKAIGLMPTSELLFARGKARMEKFEIDPDNFFTSFLDTDIGELSLKDFTDALELLEKPILEKEIRLARIRLFSMCPLEDSIWENDFAWAEDNVSDEEYGEVLFFAALKMYIFSFYASEGWDSDVIIRNIDLAFKLGFEDPKAYYLRASAHLDNKNLGLALNDINYAINMIRNDLQLLKDCLDLRVRILMAMKQFELAYNDLLDILKIYSNYKNHSVLIFDELNNELFQRTALTGKSISLEENTSRKKLQLFCKSYY